MTAGRLMVGFFIFLLAGMFIQAIIPNVRFIQQVGVVTVTLTAAWVVDLIDIWLKHRGN